MPLYEYKCQACGMVVEKLQRHNDPPPTCAGCANNPDQVGKPMTRMISRSSFKLCGTGWARDNYGLTNKTQG